MVIDFLVWNLEILPWVLYLKHELVKNWPADKIEPISWLILQRITNMNYLSSIGLPTYSTLLRDKQAAERYHPQIYESIIIECAIVAWFEI